MKQSGSALTLTGLAGAVAVAGASQAYGTVINVAAPNTITGHAPSTAGTSREYWNPATGATTTTTGADLVNFGYYNNSSTNEFFTGVYLLSATSGVPGGGVVSYYASNATNYAYGLAKGATIGTGATYATFGQKAGYYSILSLTYKGTAYAIQKPGTTYYVGFQFTDTADGLLHDGWVELESDTYTSAANPGGLKFIAAAYNNVPDASGGTIAIGAVGTNAIPEPGTLSALALGAAALGGVGLQRRRKNASVVAQA